MVFILGLEWEWRLTDWQLTNGLATFIEQGKGNQNLSEVHFFSNPHADTAYIPQSITLTFITHVWITDSYLESSYNDSP